MIDSNGNRYDKERSILWFAARKSGSNWSVSNKERVERLIAAGLMTPSGPAKIEAVKAGHPVVDRNAKRPEMHAKCLEETACLAQEIIRANQWRG